MVADLLSDAQRDLVDKVALACHSDRAELRAARLELAVLAYADAAGRMEPARSAVELFSDVCHFTSAVSDRMASLSASQDGKVS